MGLRSIFGGLVLPAIAALGTSSAYALPDYLAEAQRYGARDCAFCHVNAGGGGGHNDVGAWLVDQQTVRDAKAINIHWLAERDDIAVIKPAANTDAHRVPTQTVSDPSNPSGLEAPARPFDYSTNHGEWPAYSGDLGARKYAPLTLIDEGSLPDLKQAWTWEDQHHRSLSFERGKTPDPFKATPLMVDGGRVDLTKGLRRPLERRRNNWSHPPAICGNTIVVGNQTSDGSERNRHQPWNKNLPLGDVRGFDPSTGEQKWVFKTVPQEGEIGNDTWLEASWRWMGNTNVWSTFSCDAEAGLVYLPVTAPTQHFYGGDRPGDNLFGTSIVALNADDGSYVWHFQTVRHDIWDYDLPAPPVVIDITRDGKVTPAVAQVTKFGHSGCPVSLFNT